MLHIEDEGKWRTLCGITRESVRRSEASWTIAFTHHASRATCPKCRVAWQLRLLEQVKDERALTRCRSMTRAELVERLHREAQEYGRGQGQD